MYKFLHFGDTHLGRKHPSKISKERVESTIQALEYCIEKAIEEDVDFIVHAGDFFDTVYPWHTVIDAAKSKLEPLKEKEIPMYVIRGNHDRSFGQGRRLKGLALEHLENDYIKLIDPSTSEFPERSYIDYDENVRIYGLGYHSNKTPQLLSNLKPKDNKVNILLLHDFVDGVTRTYSENVAKADQLATKNLDYVAIGHDHQPNQEKKINDTIFAATGGTVDYDFNTTTFNKGYNIVEFDEDAKNIEVDSRTIPQTLELKKIDIKIEEARKPVIKEKIRSLIEEEKKYALKIRLTGEIEQNSSLDIPTQEISEEMENHFDQVLLVETLRNIKLKDRKEYDSESDQFQIDKYLKDHLKDENITRNFVEIHERTDNTLSNEENLTSSGFNLNKEARKDLEKEIEKVFFEE